jgi:dual specificity MAP kinase phosphatase
MTQRERPAHPLKRVASLLKSGPRALMLRFYDQIKRKITGAPVWELSRVAPGLYVGGQHYAKGWQAMEEEGITAVLNMRERWHDDVKAGVGGGLHLHLHTIDNTPVALEDLDKAADYIMEEIERGGSVYVHCGVGVGRAPSAAAAYFIKQGMTTVEALAKIRETRPFIHLTGRQRRRLEEYEVMLREQADNN